MNSDSIKLNDFDQLVLCHLISNIKVESEKDYLFIISELIKDNTNLNVDAVDLYLDVKESEEEFQAFLDEEIRNQIKKDEDTITLNLEVDAEEGLKTLEKIKSSLNETNEIIDPLLSAKKRLQDTINSEIESALLYPLPILKELEEREELAPRYLYSKGIDWTLDDIKEQLNKLVEGDDK